MFKPFFHCGYPTTATASTTTVTEEADAVDVDNRQVFVEVDSQFQEFQKNYLAMCNDMKWKLPSGSYVEDIIFNYTKDLPYEWLVKFKKYLLS